MARKFTDWYTGQVSAQLDKGFSIDKTVIQLCLSLMKPLHAGWQVGFYNHITFGAEKKLINSGWTQSGIKDAIALGLDSFSSINRFHEITPMIAGQIGGPP